ncbi:hypothetical protein EJB05_10220, partial [Eragrostis curvula]
RFAFNVLDYFRHQLHISSSVWKAKTDTPRMHVEAARRSFRFASGEVVVVIGAQSSGNKDVLNPQRAQAVPAGERLGEPRRL